MKKLLLSLLMAASLAFGGGLSQSGKAGEFDVTVSTDKPLFVGQNSFKIKVSKGGAEIKDANVKLKIWMPEMPGMPGMGEDIDAKPTADGYEAKATFSMGGGWQITTTVTPKGGKAKRYRFNINL